MAKPASLLALVLIPLLVLIQSVVSGQVLIIEVNRESGNDTEDCLIGKEPCETLDYALEGTVSNTSVHFLLAPNMTHDLESSYYFYNKSNFSFSSNGERASIECVSNDTGLSFDHSKNLNFHNIEFNHCGTSHNSTSNNFNSKNEETSYLVSNVAIFFIFCINVTFDGVVVNGSTGAGVVFYSTVGTNVISNSAFLYNRPLNDTPGGGGVAVEYIYCIPGDSNCSESEGSHFNEIYSSKASFHFLSCNFSHNRANTSSLTGDSFIVPHANSNVALGRGAGLSLLHKGKIADSTIIVENCTFSKNKAVWGGAMLIEFQDNSEGNEVHIKESFFDHNKCYFNSCNYAGTGGGGVRVQFASFHDKVIKNTVKFTGVHFTRNHAYFGGGLSFFTFPTYRDLSYSNNIYFNNCTWDGNVARLGSAVDLSLWNVHGFSEGSTVVSPHFEGCTFANNTVKYTSFNGTPTGIGAIYTDSVPLDFRGENLFVKNYGSALVGLDAAIEFNNGSYTSFYNNKGLSGGAVSLFSKAFLRFWDCCNVTFVDNSADLHGGAIYWQSVGDHQLISSRNCFMRYFNTRTDPTQWNVSLNFEKNQAKLSGDAIFATSLLGCLWGGNSYGKLVDPEQEYKDVFCWNKESTIWNYGDKNCTDQNLIATSPAYYADENNETIQTKCGKDASYSMPVVPGKPTKLTVVRMLDDRLNVVDQKSIVYAFESSAMNNTKYITYENLTYYTNNTRLKDITVRLGTITPRVMATTVTLNFTPCPPGFTNSYLGEPCTRSLFPFVNIYSNFSADIQYGYWMGKASHHGKENIYVGMCLFCPWNAARNDTQNITRNNNYIRLPDDVEDLNSFFCDGLNRNGTLCSQCKDGYCTAVNSPKYQCINSTDENYQNYAWIYYILFEYAPITALLIFVILFNVSATSGPANAFIFFAQIVSSTFSVDADGQINYKSITKHSSQIKQAYTFLYGIWNLDFFTAIDYDGWLFCLSPHIGALQIMTLKFIAAVYPLVIIVLVIALVWLYDRNNRLVVCLFRPVHWCSARFLRRLNIQRSLMDALATFFILSYVKFAVTACYLLYPNPLINENATTDKYVAYFDGSVTYGSKSHLPYLILPIVAVIWCILLPVVLFLYSTRRCYSCLNKARGFRWLEPSDLFYHLLNSFHHCLKDDRRYYAALYFFLKLALIGAFAVGLDWTKQFIYQQIICTLAILLVGTLQPYRKMKYNFLDMGMFSLLAIINVLSLYNRHQQAVNIHLSRITFYSQVILVFVPLVYFTVYSLKFILRNVCGCRRRLGCTNKEEVEDDDNFNDFIQDVEEENRLERNNYYGTIPENEGTPQGANEAAFNRPAGSIQGRSRSRRGQTEPLRSRYMLINN